MKLSEAYQEHNTELFPMYAWITPWTLHTKPILGRNFPLMLMVMQNSSTAIYADFEKIKEFRQGLLSKFLSGFFEQTVSLL